MPRSTYAQGKYRAYPTLGVPVLDKLDTFLVRRYFVAFILMNVCAPVSRTTIDIVFGSFGRAATTGVHFSTQGLDLFQGKIGGAASRGDTRFPGCRALGVHFWAQHHIGGSVQITLIVTADKLLVLGEGDIAFNDTGSLHSRSLVGFQCVLWELQASTSMSNGELVRLVFIRLGGTVFCGEDDPGQLM